MTYHGDDSYWTASVKDDASTVATWREVIRDFGPLTVNSPKDLHFNHGADLVAGVAGSDIELLQESDAILAYFDKKEQVGTLTELMHAIHNNKPALVLFSSNLVVPPAVDPFEEVNRSYQWIGGTIGMRFESPVYWFLVNFLLGDSDEVAVDSSWDGVASNVRAAVVADTNGIQQAYLEWAESVIKRFTRTECEQQ
jgi:nucleoside 2-deoxyribosyltransferase